MVIWLSQIEPLAGLEIPFVISNFEHIITGYCCHPTLLAPLSSVPFLWFFFFLQFVSVSFYQFKRKLTIPRRFQCFFASHVIVLFLMPPIKLHMFILRLFLFFSPSPSVSGSNACLLLYDYPVCFLFGWASSVQSFLDGMKKNHDCISSSGSCISALLFRCRWFFNVICFPWYYHMYVGWVCIWLWLCLVRFGLDFCSFDFI